MFALHDRNKLYLPASAPGRVQDFISQTITTLTRDEKNGQFIILMQAMGIAARVHKDHQLNVPQNASQQQVIEYTEELTRLIRLEKGA